MGERPRDDDGQDERPDEHLDERAGDRPEGAAAQVEKPSVPVTQQLGRVVVLLLLIVFVVFALSNSHRVDFSWVFGSSEVTEDAGGETTGGIRLIVLLLAAFVIGALSGAMLVRVRRRRRTRAAAERGS
jgi:uncharacterized integral membrane protein